MFRTRLRFLLFACPALLFGPAMVAAGANPTVISYQGRLSNVDGSPVANGMHELQFAIYDDSTGGSALWAETTSVFTNGGLFTHLMGSQNRLPQTIFVGHDARYLEIATADGPIAGRTMIGGVPYALVSRDLFATDANDTLAVGTFVDERRLSLYNELGVEQVRLQADADSGGQFVLYNPAGEPNIAMHGGIDGDESIQLPDSSVNSYEMLDETGYVTYVNTTPVTLPTLEMTDLITLEIETPADGYIVLQGKCYVQLSGTTGPNVALVQIDETEGGGSQFPYYTLAGLGGYATTNDSYFPIYVTRVYYKQQGIYEFRMEGRANNAPPAEARSWDHVLTATYYPTSYGVVSEVGLSPAGNPTATPLDVIDPQNPTGPTRYYQMDLRYFEKHKRDVDIEEQEPR